MHRAAAVFAEIREAGHRQAVVVAHGGLLSAALKVLIGVAAERNPFQLNNGSISKLAWDKEVKLMSLNLTEHLAAPWGAEEICGQVVCEGPRNWRVGLRANAELGTRNWELGTGNSACGELDSTELAEVSRAELKCRGR